MHEELRFEITVKC